MALKPKEAIVIPSKTLDKLWLQRLEIQAFELGGEAHATVRVLPYNDQGATGESFNVNMDNIMARIAAGDAKLAAAFQTILTAVQYEIDPNFVPEE